MPGTYTHTHTRALLGIIIIIVCCDYYYSWAPDCSREHKHSKQKHLICFCLFLKHLTEKKITSDPRNETNLRLQGRFEPPILCRLTRVWNWLPTVCVAPPAGDETLREHTSGSKSTRCFSGTRDRCRSVCECVCLNNVQMCLHFHPVTSAGRPMELHTVQGVCLRTHVRS